MKAPAPDWKLQGIANSNLIQIALEMKKNDEKLPDLFYDGSLIRILKPKENVSEANYRPISSSNK